MDSSKLPKESSASFAAGDNGVQVSDENSNNSIASVIFPWKNRRPLRVPQSETGREVTTESFYLCLMASFLISASVQLVFATAWIMYYKAPYAYLIDSCPIKDPLIFMIISGVICLPCSILFCVIHNNKMNYALLPLLIVLLVFAICFLTTGTILSYLYKRNIQFHVNVWPPEPVVNDYYLMVNQSMVNSIALYKNSKLHKDAWDTVHMRLKCCGAQSIKDWMKLRGSIPNSCYVNHYSEDTYDRGCTKIMAYDILWASTFAICLSFTDFFIEICALTLVCFIFINDKLSTTIINVV